MEHVTTFVGMDVHKHETKVAMIVPGEKRELEFSCKTDSMRLVREIKRRSRGQVECCYEAGPCGYWIQRSLLKSGLQCMVVAPSLIPRKPGERIKTDRRDALKLVRMLQVRQLTEVHPPTSQEESARDLCRAREDCREDLKRSKHRLQKYVSRQGIMWGKKWWTKQHREWLRVLKFSDPVAQGVFDDYLCSVEWNEGRLKGLEAKLEELRQQSPWREAVSQLRCFRGVDTVTAMTLVAELHGFMRFENPRALMCYLGLTPSEFSSGGKRTQGGITKAGNGHVRRLLIESAWHYRHQPRVGIRLRERRKGQPGQVVALAEKAQHRLHQRYWRLTSRGKSGNKAVTAVARELVGFIWAVLYPLSLEQKAA